VVRFWNVADANDPTLWHPPERVEVRDRRRQNAEPEPLCGFCRAGAPSDEQPSLFDEEPNNDGSRNV
jgi:hypothetical protein